MDNKIWIKQDLQKCYGMWKWKWCSKTICCPQNELCDKERGRGGKSVKTTMMKLETSPYIKYGIFWYFLIFWYGICWYFHLSFSLLSDIYLFSAVRFLSFIRYSIILALLQPSFSLNSTFGGAGIWEFHFFSTHANTSYL